MFSTLKKFFGPRSGGGVETLSQGRPSGAVPIVPANPQRAVRADVAPRPVVPPANAPNSLAVPLRAILDRLPPELAQRVRQLEVEDAHITLPMQKVLSQIAQGSVKITYGELRKSAPPGTFTAEVDRDGTMVEIPLHEILSRMNPALLSRRPVQRQVSVPAEVTGPFSGQAQVMFTTAPLKPTSPVQHAMPVQAPVAPQPVVQALAAVEPVAPEPVVAAAPILAPVAAVPPVVRPAPVAPVFTPPSIRPAPPVQSFPPAPQAPRFQSPQPSAPAAFPQAAPVAQARAATPMPVSPLMPVQRPMPPLPASQPMISRAQPVAPAPAPVAPAMPFTPPAPVATARPTPIAQLDTEQVFFRKAAPVVSPIAPTPVSEPVQAVVPPPAPVYSPIAPEPIPEAVAPVPFVPIPEPPQAIAPVVPVVPVAPVAPIITPIAPEAEQAPPLIRFTMPPPAPEPIVVQVAVPPPAPAPVMVSAPYIAPAQPAETRFIQVPVAELYLNWPDVVQQEISLHRLGGSVVALPFGLIETAIRQGRVAAPWQTVRSWIQPPVSMDASPSDATVLDLPLRVLTPLFLAELRTTKAQKRVVLDANIPDLFSGAASAAAPATAPMPTPAKPTPITANIPAVLVAAANPPAQRMQSPTPPKLDTNYFARKGAAANVETPEEAAPPLKKGPSPGTAFLVRYATPNEIISKAAALDGVDGALIALPDGLLVASHIPPTMNADTVAAFLPQIFGRVSQCTKELRLGDLNNLNFTVGNIPWKIFKVGAIYFAAFGRPGEPLPTAQLAGIAAELDRKVK